MQNDRKAFSYPKDSLTARPLYSYIKAFERADPIRISERLLIPWDEKKGCLRLSFLGSSYEITWPFAGMSLLVDGGGPHPPLYSDKARILLLRFLLNAPASKGSGAFKSYRDLPWGEVYFRQFDGRCQKRLARSYGTDLPAFERAMKNLGAAAVMGGDASFLLPVFAGYELIIRLWEGDEEFAPSCRFLFSDNFPLAFAAEDIAQMGDLIIDAMKTIR